ncbi:MAG: hypothetical protein ACR2O3_01270 [Rhizobiaceae bacterium]
MSSTTDETVQDSTNIMHPNEVAYDFLTIVDAKLFAKLGLYSRVRKRSLSIFS